MDSTNERKVWERKVLTYAQVTGGDPQSWERRFKNARDISRDPDRHPVIRHLAKIWMWQMMLWMDFGVYLHVRRHSRIKKNKYGDTFRTKVDPQDYLQELQEEYFSRIQ